MFGDVDCLLEPEVVSKNCDFVCFTDNSNIKSSVWQIKKAFVFGNNNIMTARTYKILYFLMFSNYEYNIWIDGNIHLKKDISCFLGDLANRKDLIFAYPHPVRDCVYEEAETCITLKRDSVEIIRKQVDRYKLLGYPEHNGLLETGVLFRKNLPETVRFMKLWWEEVKNYSIRDQLSFNFLIWKYNFLVKCMHKGIRDTEHFELIEHLKRNDAERLKKEISFET